MSPRLGRHVNSSVSFNHFSTKNVFTAEVNNELRPTLNIERPISELKWKVPNDSFVQALTLEGVLRNSAFVSFEKSPRVSRNKIELD